VQSATGKRGVDVVVGYGDWDEGGTLASGKGWAHLLPTVQPIRPIVQIDLRHLYWRQYSMIGTTGKPRREFNTVIFELVFWERRFDTIGRVLPCEIFNSARALEGEQFGKIVLQP